MTGISLTVLVMTIPGREKWLAESLASIRASVGTHDVTVLVSGNGTSDDSRRIASSFGCKIAQHDLQMSAEEHGRLLSSLVSTEYVWPFADDDIMPPDAVSIVVRALNGNPGCVALLGCARSFSDPACVGLGEAVPLGIETASYSDFRSLAMATRGEAHLGAIVARTSCLMREDYDRFVGTSHAFFGQVWMAVERNIRLGAVIVSEVLVDFRMSQKAWDESYVQTGAGLNRFFNLLPSEISSLKRAGRSSLPLREFARVAWLYRLSDAPHLFAFSQNYTGVLARLSPLLVPMTSPVAKALKWWDSIAGSQRAPFRTSS
jgi:hypothetical protein